MPPIIEPLNGGLVTSKDASLLQAGELSVAEHVMLLPASQTLQKAFGRNQFNGTELPSSITGITYCDFASANDQLVVVANNTYYTAPVGETGTFTTMTTGAGTTLDAVILLDKAVLMSGGTTNRVLLADGTDRPHGMRPVITAPGIVHTATGGTWPLGSTSVPGYYEYWTTEVYKSADGLDEVESTFSGTPATIQVTAITSYVTITRAGTTNPEATHWRTYRSNKKETFFSQAYPIGFLIADIPINTVSFSDGLTAVTSFTTPGAATSPTTYPSSLIVPPYTDIVASAWIDPGDITADDANTTTSPTVLTTRIEHGGADMVISMIEADTFGFTNIGSPIPNIQVKVEGSRTGSAILSAYLSPDNGTTWTDPVTIPLTTGNSTVTIDGGQWGRTWNGAEFVNGAFKLLLFASGPVNSGTGTITIDYASVAITHSGTTAQQVLTFPNIELIVGGERTPIGANGAPPRSTTGDSFQGSILMNDVDNPTNVMWTIPGTVDYVPFLYSLNIEDEVTCIRTVGSVIVVGGKGSCTRMNYLPVAEDPEFNTGRATDLFDDHNGIVSNKAAVRFVRAGRLELFYVSNMELKITTGYTVESATDDIIWTNIVNAAALDKCFVENNAKYQEIHVFFPGTGSADVSKRLRLSYAHTHLKNGKLKVVSLDNYAPDAATAGVAGTDQLLFTAKGGIVYMENRGFTDAAGGELIPNVSTREMHLAGHGSAWELPKIGIHHQGGGGTVYSSTTTALANYPDNTGDAQSTLMSTRGSLIVDTASSGDGIKLNLSGTDDGLPWAIDYLMLYAEQMGDSAPLKQ